MTEWLAALRKAFARGFTLLARFAGGVYSIAGVSQPGASACVLMSSPRCLACRCGREATAAVPGPTCVRLAVDPGESGGGH